MRLHGHLDRANGRVVSGWVRDLDAPDVPVSVVVSAADVVLGRVLANAYRADIEAAGMGGGRYAFELEIDRPLSPFERHVIAVRGEIDGAHLYGSPFTVEPAQSFDEAAQAHVARLLASTATEAEVEQRLGFLARQSDMLLDLRDALLCGRNEREARRCRLWKSGVREAPPSLRLRALVIDDRAPDPTRDAGSVAVWSHIRSLHL